MPVSLLYGSLPPDSFVGDAQTGTPGAWTLPHHHRTDRPAGKEGNPIVNQTRQKYHHEMLTHALPAHEAAAVRLGARGWRVTVLEQLDAPGGRAYVYRQDGFTFDAGPTVITAPFLLEELWALCGKRLADDVKIVPVSPFYRVRFDSGEEFNYTGDPAQMRAEIGRFAPGDVQGYENFLKASEAIYKVGFEQLGDKPFNHWTDMAKVVPQMVKLEAWRTVWQLACKHVQDPRLRVVLTFQSLLVGGNPFATEVAPQI